MCAPACMASEQRHRSDLSSARAVCSTTPSGSVSEEYHALSRPDCHVLPPGVPVLAAGARPAQRPQSASPKLPSWPGPHLQIEQAQLSTAEHLPALPRPELESREGTPRHRCRTLPVALALLFAWVPIFTFQISGGTVEIEGKTPKRSRRFSRKSKCGHRGPRRCERLEISFEDGKYQLNSRGGQDNVKLMIRNITPVATKMASIHYTRPAPQPPAVERLQTTGRRSKTVDIGNTLAAPSVSLMVPRWHVFPRMKLHDRKPGSYLKSIWLLFQERAALPDLEQRTFWRRAPILIMDRHVGHG